MVVVVYWRVLDSQAYKAGDRDHVILPSHVLPSARHFTLSMLLLSTQVYKWVPGRMRIRLCEYWLSIKTDVVEAPRGAKVTPCNKCGMKLYH